MIEFNQEKTASPNEPPPTPIEDYLPYADLLGYVKLRNEATRDFYSRAIDAQKISAEFSKIIIVNLQFINAGGLLAVPTLASNLLGLVNITRSDKVYLLGPAMFSYAAGLILASLCSFFTYRNYQSIATHYAFLGDRDALSIENVMPRAAAHRLAEVGVTLQKSEITQEAHARSVAFHYWAALIAGWMSVGCFIFSCAWLASIVR